MHPYVRTVDRDVKRDIADDFDPQRIAIIFKREPFFYELVLRKLPEQVLLVPFRAQLFHRLFRVVFQRLLPIGKASAVRLLRRHEQRKVLGRAALDEGAEFRIVEEKARKRLAKGCEPFLVQRAVVHGAHRVLRRFQLLLGE